MKKYVLIIVLVFLVGNWYFRIPKNEQQSPTVVPSTQTVPKVVDVLANTRHFPVMHFADAPGYVQHTITYLKQHTFSQSESGYVGGRVFTNYEKVLPVENDTNYWHEWDVHPKTKGVNRGTERLVTGKEGEIYFTNTHYGESGSPAFYFITN